MKETFVFGPELVKRLVGAKVKCIDGNFQPFPNLPFDPKNVNLPKRFEIYTVRAVVAVYGGGVGLLLVEIENEKYLYTNPDSGASDKSEIVFDPARFEFL